MIGQINMFDLTMEQIKIDKPIRLIETFSGYGSQAMALDEMGADFEHYKISEWEVNANKSYKTCHINDNTDYSEIYNKEEIINKLLVFGISNDGKKPMAEKEIRRKSEKWQRETYNEFMQCHNLGSITNVHGKDFKIVDTDKYFYFFTYSYPCTSVSVAGKMEGMKEGSGTQSSLLWEIKRILKEICGSKGELPQLLFMENVPQVLSSANIKDFHAWQDFLTGLGYTNHVQILNAKDYGVAQNRERAFMFSFLGEFNYKFPEPIPLTKTIKDYLEDEVDEKYYINTEKAQKLIKTLIADCQIAQKSEVGLSVIGSLNPEKECQDRVRVFGTDGISPGLRATDYKDPTKICVDLSIKNPSENNVANCITSRENRGISNQQSVGNGVIVAMRGRNPQNPSDRTAGAPTEQRLEPNSQGLCNTITSVQKDNLVLESAILTPKRTEYGKEIRKAYENGVVKESRHNMTKLEPRTDGISNTLTTVQKDNMVLERCIDLYNQKQRSDELCGTLTTNSGTQFHCGSMGIVEKVRIKQATKDGYIECKFGGVADLSYPNSDTRRERVQDNGDTCPTITAGDTEICRIESRYRIRKLTPRECGRLMFVSDTDITKMLAVVSNSQAYKQFGNSIVVLVMIAMFSNLNIQGLPNWDGIKHKYFNPPYRA